MDGEVYGLEFTLHEMLLQSPHRTLDPEVGLPGRRFKWGSDTPST